MGRLLAVIVALGVAAAAWFLGDIYFDSCPASEACTAFIPTGRDSTLPEIEWRALAAGIGGIAAWILALNLFWPRST